MNTTLSARPTVLRRILFGLLLLLSAITTKAANYYWVGGSGNWSDIAHWSTTSGGTSYHSVVPSQNDNVFFDANSGFTATNKTVIVDVAATCLNMKWDGAQNKPLLTSIPYNSAISLNVYGSFTLQPEMNYSVYYTYFKSSLPAQTITTNGAKLEFSETGSRGIYIYFDGTGEWVLQDDLIAPNTYLSINQGTFNTNGKQVSLERIASDGFLQKTLALGSSTVRLSGSQWRQMPNFNLNAGTSNIIFTSASFSFWGEANHQFYNLTFEKSAQLLWTVNANTITLKDGGSLSNGAVNNLILSPNRTYSFEANKTFTINQSLIAYSTPCTGFITLNSQTAGNQTTLNLAPGGNYSISGAMIKDIRVTGITSVTADNSFDLGNNTNINFNIPTGNTMYWVGGTGNWSDLTHWSSTSGGTPDAQCLPTAANNVVFDANSGFTSSANKVTIDGSATCKDMTWAAAPNNPILGISGEWSQQNINIYGSLTLQNEMGFEVPKINFRATQPNQTITTNGVPLGSQNQTYNSSSVTFEGSGEWILNDDFKVLNYSAIFLNQGSLNTNSKNVTVDRFLAYENSALSLGSSVMSVNTWRCLSNVFDAGTSLIDGLGSQSAFSGKPGQHYYNIRVSKPVATPSQNFSVEGTLYANTIDLKYSQHFYNTSLVVNQLILSPGKTYIFDGGRTQTINQKFTAGGSLCDGFTTIKSNYSGSKTTLNFNPGTQLNLKGLAVQDIAFAGAGTPISLTNSIDLGNNSGAIFSGSSVPTLYWVGGAGNWSDAMHWSTTSGGAPSAECLLPTNTVNVVFDENSGFLPNSNVINFDSEAYCQNMTWNNAPNKPILRYISGGGSNMIPLSIYGSLSMQKEMAFEIGYIHFKTSLPNQNIYSNGFVGLSGDWTMDGTGSWAFQDDYNNLNSISLLKGSLNTNNKNISVGSFYISGGSLSLGSSTIKLREIWSYNGGVVDAGTSHIIFYDLLNGSNSTFNSAYNPGQQYYDISFLTRSGASTKSFIAGNFKANKVTLTNDARFSGNYGDTNNDSFNTTINTLILQPSKTYSLAPASNLTINDNLYLSGSPCRVTTLQSTVSGSAANLNVLGGGTNHDFATIKDINASGSYQTLRMDAHSTNAGNNTNFTFKPYDANAPIVGLTIFNSTLYSGSPITLTAEGFFPNPATTFLWNDSSTGSSLVITKPGTYSLTVTYGDGCSISGSVLINPAAPTINCIRNTDTTITGTGLPGANLSLAIESLGLTGSITIGNDGSWIFDLSNFGLQSLDSGTQVDVRQTLNSISSTYVQAIVMGMNEPAAPTAVSPQNFKPSEKPNPTVADLQPQGNSIRWYNSETGGTPLSETNLLQVGYYFVSQITNNCESLRTKVLVTLAENPCTKPGFIFYQNNKIVGCRVAGLSNLAETTEVTGIADAPTINGSVRLTATNGVVGREADKLYKLENSGATAVSTLPKQTLTIGKIVYDAASDHFYEGTSKGWVQVDNEL